MKKFSIASALSLLFFTSAHCQTPSPALIGYWQNWQDANSPYIQLDQVNPCYNIIDVAFAIPQNGTAAKMEFIPDQVTAATLISQIQTVKGQGRKVLISVGGATAPVTLSNQADRDTFISTMTAIINDYDFDGIDLDLEGSSLSLSGGTISNPTDQPIINLIYAVKNIMQNYHAQHGKRLMLSMAPETAFVQGGMSAYAGIWGAYLPVIEALKDSIDVLHVQLYNSGSMYGIDGNIYTQGTADFIVAMTEAVIQGYSTAGGTFSGLPAGKVAIGLPACTGAAGGGYASPAVVKSAVDYLLGTGSQPGTYTLTNTGGYSTLRGLMTWSVNWDAVSSCGVVDEFADNFQLIFGTCGTSTSVAAKPVMRSFDVYPNPSAGNIHIRTRQEGSIVIYNALGEKVFEMLAANEIMQIGLAEAGIYNVVFISGGTKFTRRIVVLK